MEVHAAERENSIVCFSLSSTGRRVAQEMEGNEVTADLIGWFDLALLGCCLVSGHFLCDILSSRPTSAFMFLCVELGTCPFAERMPNVTNRLKVTYLTRCLGLPCRDWKRRREGKILT